MRWIFVAILLLLYPAAANAQYFTGPQGGPFVPSALTFGLPNLNPVSVVISGTVTGTWLLAPAPVTVPGNTTGSISFPLNTSVVNSLGVGTYSATVNLFQDGSGPITTYVATIQVTDGSPPTWSGPANISVSTAPGASSAVVAYSTPVPSDNVGVTSGPTLIAGLPTGSAFPAGTTTVTYLAGDAAGNTSTYSFNVTVVDVEDPAITAPPNISVSTDGGSPTAVVNFIGPNAATATDNVAVSSITYSPASGSAFGLGTTTVTATATDAAGNSASANFTVTVSDTEPPAITAPADFSVSNDPGLSTAVVNFAGPTAATATDNVGVSSITYSPASGSVFPLGTTTVTATATDAAGNSASASFDVTVNDTEVPSITAPANFGVPTDAGLATAVVNFTGPNAATATDNVGVTSITYSPASGSALPTGTTTVTATATDAAGNTSSATFDVTVSDNEAPAITAPPDISVPTDTGLATAVVNFTGPNAATATDNVGVSSITYSPASGTAFPLGTTTVTTTATDAAGNSSSAAFDVTVSDIIPPVATASNDGPKKGGETGTLDGSASTDTGGSGLAGYNWLQVDGVGSNTPAATNIVALSPGATAAMPTFTVPGAAANTSLIFRLTVSDNAGNSHTVWTTYGVTENTPPVVSITNDGPKKGGATAAIDGSGSTDTGGSGIASFSWEQVDGAGSNTPASSNIVALSPGTNVAAPTFTVPSVATNTDLFFKLTVTDNEGNSASQWTTYLVQDDVAPVVSISNDGPKKGGETGTIDGSGSTDAGGIDTYSWMQVDGVGSSTPASVNVVTLSSTSAAASTFTVPDLTANDSLFFKLTVTDLEGNSTTDWTTYNVIENERPTVTITSVVTEVSGVTPFPITIVFSEEVTNFDVGDIDVGNGTAGDFVNVDDKTFTAVITPTGTGNITVDVAAGAAQDLENNDNIAAEQLVVTNTLVAETQQAIASFVQSRMTHILNNQPDITGFIDGLYAGGPLGNLALDGDEQGYTLSFSSSLGRIWTAAEQAQARSRAGGVDGKLPLSTLPLTPAAMATASQRNAPVGPSQLSEIQQSQIQNVPSVPAQEKTYASTAGLGTGDGLTAAQRRGYDMWVQLHGSRADIGASESSLWVGYAGAHYFVTPNFLIGGLVQADWAEETNNTLGSSADGFGWMIGPYMALKSADQNLFFDARAAWGRSDNDLTMPVSTGNFETERWMVNAKLSGLMQFGDLSLRPAVSVSYFEETQEAYLDSLSNVIPGQTFSQGEVRFGPTFAYNVEKEDGSIIRPKLGVTGVWNFNVNNGAASQGATLGSGDIRARVDAGLTAVTVDGWSLDITGYYDGLGVENYDAWGGNARITIPIQ